MFQRALALGTALAAIGGGAAGATTEPPDQRAGSRPRSPSQHAENFTLTYDGDHKVLTIGIGRRRRDLRPRPARHRAAGARRRPRRRHGHRDARSRRCSRSRRATTGSSTSSTSRRPVTGVGDARSIVTPRLAERAAAGEIESFAPNFTVDPELVVAADPDVYVTGGYDDPATR